ncbi:MAG: hypothetical protein IJT97_00245 [Bacteroidaceae bacterium]|nr:hypothetical protein [Bacteroidaceae bacterium]
MKQIRFFLLFAAMALTSNVRAQVINGDLNHNNGLDVEDVTLLIDGYLTNEAEVIPPTTIDPYMKDNSRIAGAWGSGAENMTFNEDGTFGGSLEGMGYTYKFLPFQGRILEYDSSGSLVNVVEVVDLTEDMMLVKLSDGSYDTYIRKESHEWVDLGLSVKWATMNIGASSPEDYGDYFAWGETTTKSTYNWSTYKWCNGSSTTMTKYCTSSSFGTVDNKTVLDLEDDAANANWGGSWRMPTKAEQDELRNNCTWTWTTQNGVNGYKVTASNGNSIFLPAAGYRYDSSLRSAGSYGRYWSSSLLESNPYFAWYVNFNSDGVGRDNVSDRYRGFSVRAVCQ